MTDTTAESPKEKFNPEFDYVIVGAGPSAVGLLLGLLEPHADKKLPFSIAIIERGFKYIPNSDTKNKQRHLNRWFEASHDASSPHVSLLTVSLEDMGRLVDVPVGRGIGGGSNINAGLCVAPPAEDFEDWPEPWKSRLSRSIEHLQKLLAANHCLWDAASGEELQLPPKPSGLPEQPSIKVPCLARRNPNNNQVLRADYFEALIEPLAIKDHPQLCWLCTTEAQRLLLQGSRVIGVEVMKEDGQLQSIYARKEVILCAGAIETPALLLVSGVGPEDRTASNLTCPSSSGHVEERVLQGVGQGLRDHVILPRVLLGPPPHLNTTLNGIHCTTPFIVGNDKFYLMTSTATPEIALHFATRILQQYWYWYFSPPNLLFHFLWVVLERILSVLVLYTPIFLVTKYGFTSMNLSLVNPQSTGSVGIKPKLGVNLKTGNPHRRKDFDIQLDLGYLRYQEDINALWRGWVASPFSCTANWRGEVYPGRLFRALYGLLRRQEPSQTLIAPLWFSAFVQDASLPFFHWCGTCAMKKGGSTYESNEGDCDQVVDACCRVQSLGGLRICDASVFPTTLSVPPALTCAAMGHLLARFVLKDK